MIDIKSLRKDPILYKQSWARRGLDVDVDKIIKLDADWRKKIAELEKLRSLHKKTSEIIKVKKQNKEDFSEDINHVRVLGQDVKLLDQDADAFKEELDDMLLNLPNPPSKETPDGSSADDNVEIRQWGTKPSFDFKPQPHWTLGANLGILDLSRGAKITGSGFPLYRNKGAQLERALMNYFLDFHSEQGYEENFIPFVANRTSLQGTGQLPKFEDDVYGIKAEDFFLIPTAEVPLTNIYRDDILLDSDLPKYMMAYSPCFRREAGASGKDNRGIARVHQFNKVELVKLVKSEDSMMELETLVSDVEHLLQNLGLHYRIIELCAGDLGFSAGRCYDIEVWSPVSQKYLEVSSCSNFFDFQARRCNLKYRSKDSQKLELVNTLNGSGLAFPRCVIALLETYQDKNGEIHLPDVLTPYIETHIKKT